MLQGGFGLVGEGSRGAPGGVRWCKSATCEQRLKMGPIHPRKLKQHTLVMYKAEGRTGQRAMGGEIQVPPEEKLCEDCEAVEQTSRESSAGVTSWSRTSLGHQVRWDGLSRAAPAWDMPQSHPTPHGLIGLAGLSITYGTSTLTNLMEMVTILRIQGKKPFAEWEISSSLSRA